MTSVRELRGLSDAELKQKVEEAYQEIFNLRFRLAAKQLDNTGRIATVRRDIARMKTVLRERELGIGREVQN